MWAHLLALILGPRPASAQELGSGLEKLGLRTSVTSVSHEAGPPLRTATALGDDADHARLCALLAIVDDKPCYALLPAPKVPGEAPRFAAQGKHAAPDEVEIGPLIEGARALAGRIAARLGTRVSGA